VVKTVVVCAAMLSANKNRSNKVKKEIIEWILNCLFFELIEEELVPRFAVDFAESVFLNK
jgi:hypothetical protein